MIPRLERFALLAEIVGSFAIVVTLVVLIFEIRANTDAMEAATRQSIAARTEAITLNTATTPSLAYLLENTDTIQEGTAEARQVGAFYTALLRHTEEAYLQWQEGRLDDGYFHRRAAGAFGAMDSDHFRRYFRVLKDDFDPGYVQWVEEYILADESSTADIR